MQWQGEPNEPRQQLFEQARERARARARAPLFKHNSIFPWAPTEQMRKETRAPLAAAAAVIQ